VPPIFGRAAITLSIGSHSSLPNKTRKKLFKKQFLFVVKAIALKQQISIFYPQILSTEAGFYIYDRLVIDTNVADIVCVLNLRIIF